MSSANVKANNLYNQLYFNYHIFYMKTIQKMPPESLDLHEHSHAVLILTSELTYTSYFTFITLHVLNTIRHTLRKRYFMPTTSHILQIQHVILYEKATSCAYFTSITVRHCLVYTRYVACYFYYFGADERDKV